MVHISRRAKVLGVLVSLIAITATVSPALAHQAAAAKTKTYKVSYTVAKGPIPKNLLHLTGKITGTPFGPATFTGKTIVPITTYVWSFSGGKLDIKFSGTLKGVIASGPWKVTGGTGKFSHARGGGTATGAVDGSKQFHFVGSVSL
jgi:hypothetical protein